uniref:Uncharacterized protein n=1 Tax=Oryza brachyantha TaxID=4533 RepID=J3L6V4_ORYBR
MSTEPCRSALNSISYCSPQQSHHLNPTQQDASVICSANQELDYYYRFYDVDEAAFDGNEVELVSRVSKLGRVDYLSSPYQPSWPTAAAHAAGSSSETSRVRKKRFWDVLQSCKQKVEAQEAMEAPAAAFLDGEGDGVGAGDGGDGGGGGGGGGGADGMRLVQLLVACAEAFHFGAEIRNVVGCEGAARVERHERADQWRRRMSRAGFQSVPIKMASKAREWLDDNAAAGGYTVAEEKGCLVLGWKGKPVIAASCWKC